MRKEIGFAAAALAALCTGCAGEPSAPAQTAQNSGAPIETAQVPASGETVPVATAQADAADDPAIFALPGNKSFDFAGKPQQGIILGTDKKAGLYVFGLDGASLQFIPDGRLNNVDLRPVGDGFVAAASDRGRGGIALYRFTGSGTLAPAGFVKSDVGEPYGFCMGRSGSTLVAVLVAKDGTVVQYALADDGKTITGTEQKRFAIGSQSEGCVVDDATGRLYVGEEAVGVWRYSLDPADKARVKIAPVGDGRLVADVEGMTILREGGRSYLIVSSQGDDAFAVFDLAGATPGFVGRFHVAEANGVDAVTVTDGVDAWSGAIGPYSQGLVVMQDNENPGGAQNFKLVDWRNIKAILTR